MITKAEALALVLMKSPEAIQSLLVYSTLPFAYLATAYFAGKNITYKSLGPT